MYDKCRVYRGFVQGSVVNLMLGKECSHTTELQQMKTRLARQTQRKSNRINLFRTPKQVKQRVPIPDVDKEEKLN